MEARIQDNGPQISAGRFYIKVQSKFFLSHLTALLWTVFSVILSLPWLNDLGVIVTKPIAVLIVTGIGYIPGYINTFIIMSLIMDRQPKFVTADPDEAVTIIIACRNEEGCIEETLSYIASQDYKGLIKVIVVDNASTDRTYETVKNAGGNLNIDLLLLNEETPGKFNALNKAVDYVTTEYIITLDADTLLHKSAVRFIVSRIKSSPSDVCAVAGAVLVRNSRKNFITKLQEWDYFLGIASIKRMQGLYQGTLVAQGAFSLYKTEAVKRAGMWPDAIGEDIVLTWKFLKNNERVFFEPLAVAFTNVPVSVKHLARQRSRWARGMIEALKVVKPWQHPISYVRFLTGVNLIMPYIDLVYTLAWIPGLILAMCGVFWIAGPMTLLVLPLAVLQNFILYRYQSFIFKSLGLKIRKNISGFIGYIFTYQIIMSPMAVYGYLQEVLLLRRVWE